ncbi:hypothetical protein AMTR_s00070p00194370 [Amborella trichopoda]|uniref:Uncharacterized protein n=1 Tax=Amborella trichopoda TaxID=13333 RepID=U5DEP0_AMBTC|nr:hypothetical protein AMTR_s00070p00194370 [Amborella trichopoda]
MNVPSILCKEQESRVLGWRERQVEGELWARRREVAGLSFGGPSEVEKLRACGEKRDYCENRDGSAAKIGMAQGKTIGGEVF